MRLVTGALCELCQSLEKNPGPSTAKHARMVIHKLDVPLNFLGTCMNCHTFWVQNKDGWHLADISYPPAKSFQKSGIV